jgi:Flp pilus assembly protein TadD
MYHTVTLNIDSAIYYYRKSTDVSPSFAMGYYNLGVIYQSLGENNKASYLYNQALKYDPEYHEAKDAAAALKAATGLDIQVDPFSSQIDTSRAAANSGGYFDRGNYFASRGEYAKAASAFFRAYELDPNNTSAAINLSNCYGMLHRYPDALAAAQKVLERNPNDAAALENIAVTYKLMGKADLAKQYWEQAKKARKR